MNNLLVAYGATYTTDEEAYRIITDALDVGYRVINTCASYRNERGMGKAISQIPRKDITVISLDSNEKRSSETPESFDGYQAEMEQIHQSLESLRLDYIDLYLIHWPVPRYMEGVWKKLNADSWRAMEDCVQKGLIRRIGVSNFLPYHLQVLKETASIPIAVNQLEIHPNFQQKDTVDYCREQGMEIMSWSPLFKGKSVLLPEIQELAKKHGKTPAQIILRWDVQNRICPVICSSKKERMKSNLDIFDFELSEEDMRKIESLENGMHVDVFSYGRQQNSVIEQYTN